MTKVATLAILEKQKTAKTVQIYRN